MSDEARTDSIRVVTELLPRASDTVFIPFLTIGQKIISIFLMVAVLLLASPVSGISIILLLTVFFVGVNRVVSSWLSDNVEKLSVLLRERARFVADIISASYEIHVLNRNSRFLDIDSVRSSEIVGVRVINSLASHIPKFSFEAILLVAVVLISVVSAIYDSDQDITTLSILGLALLRIGPHVQAINQSVNLIRANAWTLSKENLYSNVVYAKSDVTRPIKPNIAERITISNLIISSPSGDLSPIGIELSRSDIAVVTGVSGLGKSTFLRYLMRDANYRDTKIEFRPTHLQSLDSGDIMGYCSQHPPIITGSVKENILFGSDQIDDLRLKAAVKFSCLEDFIRRRGLEYKIKDSGRNLSGGERMRIGLCRAIYNLTGNVMLLDEPTAALDAKTARLFCENLKEWAMQGNMVVVVSHDPVFDDFATINLNFELEK